MLVALLVASCASDPGNSDSGCSATKTGGFGALVGALAGAAVDSHSRGTGALIGAAAGGAIGALGCLAYNYSTKQKRTAQQVEHEYQQQHATLPKLTQVVRYSAELQPNKAISGGTSATLVSNVELVQGSGTLAPKVEETVEMRSPDGKVLNRSRKEAQGIKGSGDYENQFKFTLPQGVDEGVYPIDVALYVDGEEKQKRSVRMQVASNGNTRIIATR
jgi:hypothetical protein